MKKLVYGFGAGVLLLATVSPAAAFPSRGMPDKERLAEPLPTEHPKRTWEFMKTFTIPYVDIDYNNCSAANEQFRDYVRVYRARAQDLLSGKVDDRKLRADRPLFVRGVKRTSRKIRNLRADIDQLGTRTVYVSEANKEREFCLGMTALYNLFAIKEGLLVIRRLYPDMTEIEPVMEELEAVLAEVGSEEDIRSAMDRNFAETLEKVRMKPAKGSSPARKKMYRDYLARVHPDRQFIKVHLMGDGWNVYSHWLTGRPVYRTTGAWIANRKANGKCYIMTATFRQAASGGSYSGGEFRRTSEIEILCKNI